MAQRPNGRAFTDTDNSGAFKPSPRRGPRDRDDVVAMMKRDMSYAQVAANLSSDSSDEESNPRAQGINETMDHSHTSRSRQSELGSSKDSHQQKPEQQAMEDGIDLRRKLVLLLLGVVVCMVIVAIAAVSIATQKDKENQTEQVPSLPVSYIKFARSNIVVCFLMMINHHSNLYFLICLTAGRFFQCH